jgi:hypothetical protein
MILPDVNLLVYSYNRTAQNHAQAKTDAHFSRFPGLRWKTPLRPPR